MDRVNHAAFAPPSYDPTQKLPKGPSLIVEPAERAFIASWLDHVSAGRIGVKVETPEDIRAVTLANERLICGDGCLPIW